MLGYTPPAVVGPAADVHVHHVALERAVGDELLVALVALVAHLVVRLHAVAAVLAVAHDGHAAVVALEAVWRFNCIKKPQGWGRYFQKVSKDTDTIHTDLHIY